MKIYAALGGWDDEGYAEPIGLYSTAELAFEALRLGYDSYSFKSVVEYELDDLRTWPDRPTKNEIKPGQ